MLGPSGVGVLYGREDLLDRMPPFHGGGSMIKQRHDRGLRAGRSAVPVRSRHAGDRAGDRPGQGDSVPAKDRHGERPRPRAGCSPARPTRCWPIFPACEFSAPRRSGKGGIVTFALDGIHPDDVSKALDVQGIAVRAGHHCAMPLHERLGLSASARASFYLYNTPDEVARLAAGIREARRILGR